MRKIYLFLCCFASLVASGQELACQITVNTQQVNQTNQQVFKTLEKSVQELVNRTQWTSLKVLPNEKIQCSLVFTITGYENNQITADVQIQSSRPVYNSVYQSNILNYREKSVVFTYLENEPLFFNPNTYTSELTSLVAYYALLIIGLDADTFALGGGSPYYREAHSVVLNAQVSGNAAWQQSGDNNRWRLVTDLLSTENDFFHEVLYNYHRKGLDILTTDETACKNVLKQAILLFDKMNSNRLNRMLPQLFFDAKSDEIAQIFSSGKTITGMQELKSALERLAPLATNKWQTLK